MCIVVVRLDVSEAVFPPLDEVLEERLAFAAMRALHEASELLGKMPVPKWEDLGDDVAIALRAAVRAVYLELALAGGAVQRPITAKKKG